MDKDTRNAIEGATQRARKLLEEDFAKQLAGTFDVLATGEVAEHGGEHLDDQRDLRLREQRAKIVAALDHKRAAGLKAADAVGDYRRDAAFTALNRFVALKMLEARELVQECVTRGEQSAGYREFCGLAPGIGLLPFGSNVGLRARFAEVVLPTLEETPLSKDQRLTKELDGHAILEATVPDTLELRAWLASYGPHVEVLAPPELRAQIGRQARETAALYASTDAT